MSNRFVIVTTQRTGGTYLRTCLESHPDIECPGTLFPQKSKFKYFSVDGRNSYYRKFRTRTLGRRIAHWVDRERLVYECLNEAYSRGTSASARGFKTSYSNLERYPSIVTWLHQHDICIIHWLRQNLVKRYISHLTKDIRKLAHSTKPVNKVTVHVNPRRLLRNLEMQSNLIDKYRAIFQEGAYTEAYYEIFISNQDAESRRILNFLGVNEHIPIQSGLVKQNPDNLTEIIENYDEVAARLTGTRFEVYLDTSS